MVENLINSAVTAELLISVQFRPCMAELSYAGLSITTPSPADHSGVPACHLKSYDIVSAARKTG